MTPKTPVPVTHEVMLAPLGCYIVRLNPDGSREPVRAGIKRYDSAVKLAAKLDRDAARERAP
jgi:hypothetical protein